MVDQIFIKALRIRTIQDKGVQRVGDDIASEFKGIINYGVIGLIQLALNKPAVEDVAVAQVNAWYEQYIGQAKATMLDKNHDYGEAWREMRISSITDLIYQKVLRTKQIEDNQGKTLVSEGLDANYYDMLNYAVFCLIKMMEEKI